LEPREARFESETLGDAHL